MSDEWTAENVVSFIESMERDGFPVGETVPIYYHEAFQIMIDSGLAFKLGRKWASEASRLIDEKRCTPPHKIFCIGCQD